jgi:hypothetical protein
MFFVQSFGYSSWESTDWMDNLSAQIVDDVPGFSARSDDLTSCFQSDFSDNTQDIPLPSRGLRSDHKIRATQEEEMQSVIFELEGVVYQFPDHLGCRSGVDMKEIIQGLGGCHVVSGGTDATDAGSDPGHFLSGPSYSKLLESAEFWNLEKGSIHIAFIIQEDLYFSVAF